MALETLVLRPSSDKSCQHSASSGSACYAMLNEETADDDATYIYQTINSTSNRNQVSNITLSGDSIVGNITVKSATLLSRAKISKNGEVANYSCAFSLPQGSSLGIASGKLSASYSNHIVKDINLVDKLNQYATEHDPLPSSLDCVITTEGKKSSAKNGNGYIRITQVYVAIDYELNEAQHLFVKENNVWQPYTKGYKKQNGVWVSTDITSLFNTDTLYVKG